MNNSKTRYGVELLCGYPEWRRYNVYIMAVGFAGDSERVSFDTLSDRPCEPGRCDDRQDVHGAPQASPRVIRLDTDPCEYADIYVYVVANTFPSSDIIKESPSFTVELRVYAEDRLLESSTHEVNQWGGLTIVAHRVGLASE